MKPIKNSPFTKIGQVGAIVKDIDKVVEYYNSLGIGPFRPLRQVITHTEFHGKPIAAKTKILITSMGEVDFELIQPLEGPSIWQDFLEKKEEGLHHLGFFVDNIDEAEKNVTSQGLNIIQKGRGDKGGYTYFDTNRIGGVVFELVQKPTGAEVAQTKAAGNPFAILHHVGAIVTDMDEAIGNYAWLGIGPFRQMKWEITRRWLRGVPSQFKNKLYIKQVGAVELELIQPIEGNSVNREFLRKKGERLHHLGFLLKNIDEETEKLQRQGVKTTQYGRGPSDGFNYFDTDETGGVVVELIKRGPQD